ncbi:PREDICTED: uncharacterized protein LOC109581126 [Amphimedon queenslandica]|uniref:Uncharacterized protein n=1 Tax=Amphimedon queenslandica TaxID=400682 RepID=A0A1X7V7N4_AMPQE|nr:PREDICTED: uncharacterized protein LOC109581126 [Amphimedon queenslandica]|eukprot:XP_019850501.1 PREDICTED: uncharacterized protein LOC109581126 [Amphimedon queenslandica]
MYPSTLVVIILVSSFLVVETDAISFGDLKRKIDQGVGFANELLGESGEIPRGTGGCVVKWNIQGTLRGLKWKWVCTCRDTCTGIVEVQTKYSRDGSLEHCLTHLFQRLGKEL